MRRCPDTAELSISRARSDFSARNEQPRSAVGERHGLGQRMRLRFFASECQPWIDLFSCMRHFEHDDQCFTGNFRLVTLVNRCSNRTRSVQATNDAGRSISSTPFSFCVQDPPTGSITMSPSDGATVTIPLLSWSPIISWGTSCSTATQQFLVEVRSLRLRFVLRIF
jgi:hypothetical protein